MTRFNPSHLRIHFLTKTRFTIKGDKTMLHCQSTAKEAGSIFSQSKWENQTIHVTKRKYI